MAFVFKITTTASPQTFTIPCQDVGTFNATIDWGDGSPTSSITAYNDADLAHSYATAGQYTVTITGTFPNIYFNNGGDAGLLDEVVDLGDVGWQALDRAFWGCSNMTAFDGGTADTSSVTDMTLMFHTCSSLTALDLSAFDTSSVTNMYLMFYNCSSLTTLDVSGFDVSSVTNMGAMFQNCSSLTTLDVSGFDVSSVTNMGAMFQNCSSVTGLQISGWDISSVTDGTDFLLGANAALSQAEYDATLLAWAQQTVQPDVNWHFGDATYSNTPIAVSIQMDGRMTYADENEGKDTRFFNWEQDANNNIEIYSATNAGDGRVVFKQEIGGVSDATLSGGSVYSPGVNVPFSVASRHGSTFINGAIDGVALSANTTPTALPDLSSMDMEIAPNYMGTIRKLRLWADDLGDAGIEAAST